MYNTGTVLYNFNLLFLTVIIIYAAELGDYEEGTHTPAFISEFRFVPNQNEEFEIDVMEAYKKLRYNRASQTEGCVHV